MKTRLALAGLACLFLVPSAPARAQTAPRILIAFDTSGSMALDLGGTPTFGDGVLTGCSGALRCGANCTAGIDTDCDGLANDSRIQIAKQAVTNMVLAFGDVDWAFSRFAQNQATNTSCLNINNFECAGSCTPGCSFFITSYGNPQCNSGAAIPTLACTDGANFPSLWPAACRPGTGGRPPLRMHNGASPTVCTNYDGVCAVGGSGGDILVGFPNMGAYAGMDNTYGMLSWLDGQETNFINSRALGNFCNAATVGDCEVRPEGPTPLAGQLTAAGAYMTPIRAADPAAACRPYSVILLTDGVESCGGNAPVAAAALLAAGIQTYVVGFATGAGASAPLNAIATAGGTDAGAPGGDSAFFATNQVELAAGLSDIVRRSLLSEVCNGLDDDCDILIDEGVTNACGGCGAVPVETCNMMDDDCDGTTDEGVSNACGGCGPAPVEVCNRLDDDCDGIIDEDGMGGDICAGCMPTAEICDGMDNDCDMTIDEGITRACGSGVGECTAGLETCMVGGSGMFGSCVGATGPTMETCDGLDNDCDGAIDGFSRPCGTSVGTCVPGFEICTAGSFGSCVGGVGPGSEVCDGLDNDCDMSTDEMIPPGGACGSAIGICMPGTRRCMGGMFTCVGGSGPDPSETCNTLDDDCDGLIDEGNPGGGTACGSSDVGACSFGAEACAMGSLMCVGAVGPTPELCDGVDNDCDGMIDEGDPEGGGMCGDDTGECMSGTFRCISATLTCMGGIGPTMEICDGLDNDCDGVIDDGIPVGAPCGTDVGECVPGRNVCRMGAIVCEGGIPMETESCDNLDNDCDGTIDEGLGVGGPCGTDMGLCMEGTQRCIAGRLVCEGEVGPTREGCDCDDNDCDGTVDETPMTGTLCPPGSSCVDCQCALPCMMSEFGFVCPTGRFPREEGGMCFCVAERCDPVACATETRERDGETLCEPDSLVVSTCVCKNNDCTFPCDGVVCSSGTVCDPRDPLGRCVENNCRGLGCPAGEICDIATGECGTDPCEAVTCAADEACRSGTCEDTCATVDCPEGETCSAGTCSPDLCFGRTCAATETCDPATGDCIDDLCLAIRCAAGQVCELTTGNCIADPCAALRCPDATMCVNGECVEEGVIEVDAGTDAGVDASAGDMRDRVLAHGGCGSCIVSAEPERRDDSPWLLLLGLLGLVVYRRRRRKKGAPRSVPFAVALGIAAVVALSSGCDVDPFCLDCDDGADAGVEAGVDSGAFDAGSDAGTDGGFDAGPDACLEEICNGLDDDCDGTADEGFDLDNDTENCGGCGDLCAPIGAFPVCTAGVCGIGDCDVGRIDLDMDPTNGCEYRCLVETPDDAVCDLRDNDCDGNVDEDIDTDTDPTNCGSCGVVCTFPHAAATCAGGVCVLGACDADFFDVDMNPANGCEYSCTPAAPSDEVCNLADDDCDGMIDEGDPGGGGGCGSSVGACTTGTEACVGGSIQCTGGTLPSTETCDGTDEDCDSSTDEGNPEGGRVCGTSTGTCIAGRETCTAGALLCMGDTGPGTEICDGLDNDCDSSTDEGNPGGGGSCGTATGACMVGTNLCSGGVVTCTGAVGPVIETCNTIDDDCDGPVDENFDLMNDRNNCGTCGTTCGFTNAVAGCSAGTCVIIACDPGFVDVDGMSSTGCEYMCSFAGSEICNGADDDCNGMTDEGLTPPSTFCNPNGVCMGTVPTCMGMAGYVCTYPMTFEVVEVSCDTLDNDCDGATDEPFPTLGNPCANGTGACRETGSVMCLADGSGTFCTAAPAGMPGVEACNNEDDDCDGIIDNNLPLSALATVNIGGGVLMMTYEASRPDASSSDGGTVETLACSNANVLPWTNVLWTEARDACCALNAGGACLGGGAGWRLCDSSDWQSGCESSGGSCEWSYNSMCTTSSTLTCNGEEFDSNPGMSGDQDAIFPTGSATFSSCNANWGGAGTIFDLSGNVKEWTNTSPLGGVHEIRGGAYNNVEPGRSCGFDFTVGDNSFAFPNTGFRCCMY